MRGSRRLGRPGLPCRAMQGGWRDMGWNQGDCRESGGSGWGIWSINKSLDPSNPLNIARLEERTGTPFTPE